MPWETLASGYHPLSHRFGRYEVGVEVEPEPEDGEGSSSCDDAE